MRYRETLAAAEERAREAERERDEARGLLKLIPEPRRFDEDGDVQCSWCGRYARMTRQADIVHAIGCDWPKIAAVRAALEKQR